MNLSTSFYRYLALFSYSGLLILVISWHSILVEETPYSGFFIFLIYILPLLLPLKGIAQANPYTHAWANFIVMLYLIHGFTISYAEPALRLYGIIEILLATLMFIGCSFFARKRGRELNLGLKKLKVEMQEERDRFNGVK
ncbi:DUF2069 domain-containing protein [Alteromonas sp. ASW11-130]|uniref:DUF2069 domain-containing protein n=1 Tax=Alteromonas sp. ASW11-130 TaxID=3015775 RepID=UPI00224198CF|nr:DUF2069 domain-containing protein [Alteromonas sp. ASW11-130]MCW8092424.1 DUF2069 domain-containing protein [Alteromonas sp. ASW11-130]